MATKKLTDKQPIVKLYAVLVLMALFLNAFGSIWAAHESHIANIGVLGMMHVGEELHQDVQHQQQSPAQKMF